MSSSHLRSNEFPLAGRGGALPLTGEPLQFPSTCPGPRPPSCLLGLRLGSPAGELPGSGVWIQCPRTTLLPSAALAPASSTCHGADVNEPSIKNYNILAQGQSKLSLDSFNVNKTAVSPVYPGWGVGGTCVFMFIPLLCKTLV